MRNIIVGTAGHIDHGKTALVRALTGIDTDRLEEEKRRGISIDLGFAHMAAGGIRFGFVDVPGHERFVRNMLAGVGGIDLVVLVVAADEGVKPQTREHFEICRLLGIRHGLIALTKCDLVDADWLGLVRMELGEFVAGSFLAGAPAIPVSSRTGEGLDALRAAMVEMAGHVEARSNEPPFRLPVDRSFTLHGFGTVVTGTLWRGTLRVGDEAELYPPGKRLRVRGIQVHGGAVEAAEAGQRTAVNLAGIETGDVHRGMTLAPAGWFEPTQLVDCTFQLLTGAHPLKHRAPVHFHAGTAETEAEVRLLESLAPVEPGSAVRLRLKLKEPLLLLPGDRFIARMFSPVVTIGGGVILDNRPLVRMRRQAAAERLAKLDGAAPEARLAVFAAESEDGAGVHALAARMGVSPEAVAQLTGPASLVEVKAPEPWLIAKDALTRQAARLREALTAFHAANPLLPGMPKASAPVAPFVLEAILERDKEVVAEGEVLRLAKHRLALKQDEDEALGRIESLFRDAGLAVPAVNDVLARSGVDANRARSILQILLRQQRLVRVSPDLIYHAQSLESLKTTLAAKKGVQFGVGEFKDWTGVSRKYAIPLLEFLDRLRLTRRLGDKRVVV